MNTKIIYINCPEYQFNKHLDLDKVSSDIDNVLISNFNNKNVILRGIQSEKHILSKKELIEIILKTGTDRYGLDNINEVIVSHDHIDLFGFACKIVAPITLPILEGFHKWKPKSLERPQCKVDIWMVYDAKKLKNVEYDHSYYNVKANDGYIFIKPKDKVDALLGVLVIE